MAARPMRIRIKIDAERRIAVTTVDSGGELGASP
jgi:hypothetical protein